MHPNPVFRPGDEAGMLDWAVGIGFAHIFVTTPDLPLVVHAPVVTVGERRLRFHVARANRATPHLDGARVLLSIAGAQGYITPNWYVAPGQQVPTWDYTAVEIDGVARACDDDALVEQLDRLAAIHEPRVIPENPWTRAKMDEDRFRAMLRAIIAFEVEIDGIRGTRKLSQNKSAADRAGVVAGLMRSGHADLAREIPQ
ncbi:FMN-binding negative transcriptional regulator [Sphingomonas sp. So64.6b]|uniref:FMN-binding negative transcriptional regulator n=1 Tax=Sphingomonas sp. So64.6b TaxID=2997354 RepID=UPI00160081A8|nr:FMN-binding negative transcriptional regulator [Sphingomonas sp. So64.6b]QNA85069.1 FMN-binding negative transcriptional regulator [Sphingomonas sp. So64.6b]